MKKICAKRKKNSRFLHRKPVKLVYFKPWFALIKCQLSSLNCLSHLEQENGYFFCNHFVKSMHLPMVRKCLNYGSESTQEKSYFPASNVAKGLSSNVSSHFKQANGLFHMIHFMHAFTQEKNIFHCIKCGKSFELKLLFTFQEGKWPFPCDTFHACIHIGENPFPLHQM